jgi:hypothetical protein
MSDVRELEVVAQHLRELVAMSPTQDGPAMEAWYVDSDRIYKKLLRNHPTVHLPIQVMHYVHDADIRVRDADYRASQTRMMEEIILSLERGVIPESSGVTISVRLRTVVVTAFVVLVLVGLAILRACEPSAG